MHYCVKCGAQIAVKWGQRPICADCQIDEAEKAEPQPEPTQATEEPR